MSDSMDGSKPVLAVLLSGGGRTLSNLIERSRDGTLDARIGIVISSNANAGGLEVARDAGIPAVAIVRREFDSEASFSDALFAEIAPFEPKLMILAGFLRKIVVPAAWDGRILNIHPALLPECSYAAGRGFYGEYVHQAVLDRGETQSGATVHLVDNGYDTGPVYMRETVAVLSGDTAHTLADRVFEAEKELYPRAIAAYLEELEYGS
jgi:formyltetrahydrofolate-dependent phosphoribosylglycinamide formyltransferase